MNTKPFFLERLKLIYSLAALLFLNTSFGQVGVGTTTPKSDLHISKTSDDGGTIQIDGGIRLGGDSTTIGDKGEKGQVLVSNGSTESAEWVTLGDIGGYITNCSVPNVIAFIDFILPDGSNRNAVNVTSSQVETALNSLPNGGIIILRTNTQTTYNNVTTYITVELPVAINNLNKPFSIAFDGPTGQSNLIANNKNFQIVVKATETNSLLYEFDSGSTIPKVFIRKFDTDNIFDISELNNDTGTTQKILLYNSGTIKALDDKTWAFINRTCYIQNPN